MNMTGGYDLKPYTSKAKKAIDLAARISKKMNYSYVGTEHILAGLIKRAPVWQLSSNSLQCGI